MSDTDTAHLEDGLHVLDHGFVRLIDHMGDDARIVQAARVSYGKGTKTAREDRNLIDYLVRNKHTSPIEKVRFEFHVKLPIFLARQWMRHRTGSFNEVSARYSEMANQFYEPEVWRGQSDKNKQVSAGEVELDFRWPYVQSPEAVTADTFLTYQELLEQGVSREQARTVLPVSLYTEFYWTVDAHNLLHFLELRMHSHAQEEIRQYANAIHHLIQPIIPWTVEAWEEHRLNGASLSRTEIAFLRDVLHAWYEGAENGGALQDDLAQFGLRKSRRREFMEKIYGPGN